MHVRMSDVSLLLKAGDEAVTISTRNACVFTFSVSVESTFQSCKGIINYD